jgi:3-oxoacyl-[acyl-carrier protein] reductase
MVIEPNLNGKVAIVTGANHGIGAATARAFAKQDTSVFINYYRRPLEPEFAAGDTAEPGEAFYRYQQTKTADEVIEEIRAIGGRVEAWEANLAEPDTIPQLFDRAEKAFGPVEILVNNAAHGEADTFRPRSILSKDELSPSGFHTASFSADSHDGHFAVNSRAVALMMAEFARRHVERGASWGRIINISTDGSSGFPDEISYWASKHAMESYSRAAARELGQYGITVNIVSPGAVQTGYISSELQEYLESSYPLRRIGQPEDIADAIVFFASEQARWITGQLLYVGGGNRMSL